MKLFAVLGEMNEPMNGHDDASAGGARHSVCAVVLTSNCGAHGVTRPATAQGNTP